MYTYKDLLRDYKNAPSVQEQHKLLVVHKDILIYQSAIVQQKTIADDLQMHTSKLSNILQILKVL